MYELSRSRSFIAASMCLECGRIPENVTLYQASSVYSGGALFHSMSAETIISAYAAAATARRFQLENIQRVANSNSANHAPSGACCALAAVIASAQTRANAKSAPRRQRKTRRYVATVSSRKTYAASSI